MVLKKCIIPLEEQHVWKGGWSRRHNRGRRLKSAIWIPIMPTAGRQRSRYGAQVQIAMISGSYLGVAEIPIAAAIAIVSFVTSRGCINDRFARYGGTGDNRIDRLGNIAVRKHRFVRIADIVIDDAAPGLGSESNDIVREADLTDECGGKRLIDMRRLSVHDLANCPTFISTRTTRTAKVLENVNDWQVPLFHILGSGRSGRRRTVLCGIEA